MNDRHALYASHGRPTVARPNMLGKDLANGIISLLAGDVAEWQTRMT